MMKTFYTEEQYFTQYWLWLVLIIAMGAMIVPMIIGIYTQLILGQPWGNSPMSDLGLLMFAGVEFGITFGLIFLFVKMRLITKVDTEGLSFRFPPLILKERKIRKDEIKTFVVRNYKPVKEYGGWGIKYGLRRNGKAYNVKGNIGMQLELINGHKVLFGTQRADAFQYAMEKMMKESN